MQAGNSVIPQEQCGTNLIANIKVKFSCLIFGSGKKGKNPLCFVSIQLELYLIIAFIIHEIHVGYIVSCLAFK